MAHELVSKYQKSLAHPDCASKVDLRKAYDSICWDYIEEVMVAMNFPRRFMRWVMQCVRSASFTILINGSHEGYFSGKKGLRQGDPISPLLFTVAIEYLTRLLAEPPAEFKFHSGCEVSRINHLSFADDLFLFSKADESSLIWMQTVLEEFYRVSGLSVNGAKSSIYFQNGTSGRARLTECMGFQEGELPVRYLGVPLIASRLRKSHCKELLEKVAERLSGWKANLLSYSGRLLLINTAVRSLTIYWCQFFTLPKSVVKEIDRKCRAFLWNGEKRSHVAWKEVCYPKLEGGLGIKDLVVWNEAAIGKLVWHILTKPESLWVQWITEVRLSRMTFWGVKKPPDSSNSWKYLLALRVKLKPLFEYTIGRDCNWKFWYDPWFFGEALVDKLESNMVNETGIRKQATIGEVRDNGAWRLPETEVEDILGVWKRIREVPTTNDRSCITWRPSASGQYTIKSAWNQLRDSKPTVGWAKLIWGQGCFPRFSFTSWLAVRNRLPMKTRIFKWGMVTDTTCPLCSEHEENIEHLFFECSFTRSIWEMIMPRAKIHRPPGRWRREVSWFTRHATGKSRLAIMRRRVFTSLIYHVWKERNEFVFKGKVPCPRLTFHAIVVSVYHQDLHRTMNLRDCLEAEWF